MIAAQSFRDPFDLSYYFYNDQPRAPLLLEPEEFLSSSSAPYKLEDLQTSQEPPSLDMTIQNNNENEADSTSEVPMLPSRRINHSRQKAGFKKP